MSWQHHQEVASREDAGHTQQEIADAVGIPRKTIDDSFGEFGDIAVFAKTDQNAANHEDLGSNLDPFTLPI